MKYIFIILFIFLAPLPLQADDAEPKKIENVIAEQVISEEDAQKPIEPIIDEAVEPSEPEKPPAIFNLTEDDILSWEESGEGKYLYFELSARKNEELATLTEEHIGSPMQISLEDIVIFIPRISNVLNQRSGFALRIDDKDQRQGMKMLLGMDKFKNIVDKTPIKTAPQ